MKPKLTHEQEKIRDLLYGDPREKLLALTFMKDWTLGEMCNFLDTIRKPGTWRNAECTLIVLSMFSENLIDNDAWRGWKAMLSHSALPWNRHHLPDKLGVLSKAQVAYGHNRNNVNWMFDGILIGVSVEHPIDLFKEIK